MSDPKWILSMKEELKSINKNKTWELVDPPEEKKSIGVRWMYKVNPNPRGKIIKHKVWLVAKEFLQREDTDFDEVFASISINETIRLVIGIANNNNWSIYQIDVKFGFFNGKLEEEVYAEQL